MCCNVYIIHTIVSPIPTSFLFSLNIHEYLPEGILIKSNAATCLRKLFLALFVHLTALLLLHNVLLVI